VIEITPTSDCKACHGGGLVRGDSVPYGSTWANLPDDYCDCVIEQLPDDDNDYDITVKLSAEVLAREEAANKAEDEFYARMEANDEEARKFMESRPLPQSEMCSHGKEAIDCNPCMIAGDLAYDAARERRVFGR
jgi:hypothetical protein